MSYRDVFKRYELKFLLDHDQKERLLTEIEGRMTPDSYGRTTIRNIYYDTDNYRIIRASLAKPLYKEKLRMRSYRCAGPDDTVFVELKKKYDGIVYKRRVALPLNEAGSWLEGASHPGASTQITDEVDYFLDFYTGLKPKAFITYEREAYQTLGRSDFRITLDENILYRSDCLNLGSRAFGRPLIPEDSTLMELKIPESMPVWMADFLTKQGICRVTYSKYGTAYMNYIFENERSVLYA